jgi:hypothetical protein
LPPARSKAARLEFYLIDKGAWNATRRFVKQQAEG